jgi:anti-sigma factor RsiW
MTAAMHCNELVEVVTAYLEGTLPGPDRARFEAHLTECPFCVDYVEQMRMTVDRLGRLDAETHVDTLDTLPDETRTRLVDAFRDWRR